MHLLTPNCNALLLIPSFPIIKLHNSSEGGSIALPVLIIYKLDRVRPFVITLRIIFLIKADFFKIKKINDLGNRKILILLLEYLTNVSVKMEIKKTSMNLDSEYIIGTND